MKVFPRVVLVVFGMLLFYCSALLQPALAFYQPLATPNNKYGITILQPSELPVAAHLVNATGGDWGYVVTVIQSNDRNVAKWQQFMNQARQYHIIPIIRIATTTQGDYWTKPAPTDATDWAKFFAKLYWPTNNHYVIIYNEPNHAQEWGNTIDPAGFAMEMQKTIVALKQKDPNIFILNPGFDAAAPDVPNQYMDEAEYMQKMNQAVPEIFQEIDGWASHSYPQPNYSGDPLAVGRNTITTYRWEEQLLDDTYNIAKLPVFITETGWTTQSLSEDQVAANYKTAYTTVWTDANLVAVVPFTLSYLQPPFAQFSWIHTPIDQAAKVLGVATNDSTIFGKQYQMVAALGKIAGKPLQQAKAQFLALDLPTKTTPNSFLPVSFTMKNTGESQWFTKNTAIALSIQQGTEVHTMPLQSSVTVDPGSAYPVQLQVLAPTAPGTYSGKITILAHNAPIASLPYQLTVAPETPDNPITQPLAAFFTKIFERISAV